MQLQLPIVEGLAGLGIGGQQDLEAPVEQEVLDPVGADPAPDPVGGLQDGGRDPLLVEAAGAAEPGQPGPDDVDAAVPLGGHLAAGPTDRPGDHPGGPLDPPAGRPGDRLGVAA